MSRRAMFHRAGFRYLRSGHAVVALVVIALAACVPSKRGPSDDAAHSASSGGRAITREMIAKWNVLHAYDAIERGGMYHLSLSGGGRVSVTQRRGQTSLKNGNADHPVLLLDGAIMRDYDMLRQVRAS